MMISVNASNFDAALDLLGKALGFGDAARTHLESLGRGLTAIRTIDGMVKLATFDDPDGNAWMLAQQLETDDRDRT